MNEDEILKKLGEVFKVAAILYFSVLGVIIFNHSLPLPVRLLLPFPFAVVGTLVVTTLAGRKRPGIRKMFISKACDFCNKNADLMRFYVQIGDQKKPVRFYVEPAPDDDKSE